jgi:hypothetical protein
MYAEFERFEIEMTLEQAYSVSEPGMDAIDAVNALIRQLDLSGLQPDKVREELWGYGAWDEEELADDEDNLRRIVWIAGCNLREEDNI